MNQSNIKLTELAAELRSNSDLPVVFYFDGIAVKPGYHVTEVKHVQVSSLDCGRGTDQWEELIVQLLDGNAVINQTHMGSSKLLGILEAAFNLSDENATLQLYFEYAPDNGPLYKLAVESMNSSNDQLSVTLCSLHAACKPMQRLRSATNKSTDVTEACCGSVEIPEAAAACCASVEQNPGSACC